MKRLLTAIAVVMSLSPGCNWLQRNLGFSQINVISHGSDDRVQPPLTRDEPNATSRSTTHD